MNKILSNISTPKDLKGLTVRELEMLSEEIRDFIISHVSRTGGHLASSLGTVELTLALHYVFNTPQDKILWDVGHQTYPHKIITGRKDRFTTLRQKGGLSAFINPNESPYDVFISGHTGNAISAASGISEAFAKAGCSKKVIAVIGDGSLSNGLTFEGLNFIGMKKQDMIVVLNDNNMFISRQVGAVADYLSRTMTSKRAQEMREGIKSTLRSIPVYGDTVYKVAKHIEVNLKGVVAEGILFEEMGLNYVGPIDGHNIAHLIEAFNNISTIKGPILIHLITQKGRGFKPAVDDPENFHGIGKFDRQNGESKQGKKYETYSDVFGKHLMKLAENDPRIVAVSAAMTTGTGLKPFAEKYPERFYDVGIAEGHAITMASGMALYGLKPFVAIYSTFLQRGYDEIIHDVAIQNTPVIFAVDRAGLVGPDGPTHHGVFDIEYLRGIPNMTIMAPRDQRMLPKMMQQALKINGPVAIRYPRQKVVGSPVAAKKTKIGRAEVLKDGTKAVIFTLGPLCYEALEAASDMEGVAVVDLVFAKPLDEKLIRQYVSDCGGRFIVAEDGNVCGGVGSAIVELLTGMETPLRFKLLGIPDRFIEQGSLAELRDDLSLDAKGIKECVMEVL